MALDIQLLRSTFAAVAPRADELTAIFYSTLFERHPELQPLFAAAQMPEQRKKLVAALAFVVANVDKPESLTTKLHSMGAEHLGYGARDDHYPAVGECLLHALSEVAGDGWTPDVAEVWVQAYDAVSSLLIEGAAQARGAA